MIICVAAVVVLAVLLIRWLAGPGQSIDRLSAGKTPLDILRERFARGEIEKEEFDERRRIFDPRSRHRRAMVQPGWRCLEIGAGRGSMAVWLAGQVGSRAKS